MRSGVAAIERENISHRTRTALRQKAQRGLHVGGPVREQPLASGGRTHDSAGAGEVSELVARVGTRSRQLADVRAKLASVTVGATAVPLDVEARPRAAVVNLRGC